MAPMTKVRCTSCGHTYATVVAPQVVEAVRRCERCSARALIVVAARLEPLDHRAIRRRAIAQRTLAIELRTRARSLRDEARTARVKEG